MVEFPKRDLRKKQQRQPDDTEQEAKKEMKEKIDPLASSRRGSLAGKRKRTQEPVKQPISRSKDEKGPSPRSSPKRTHAGRPPAKPVGRKPSTGASRTSSRPRVTTPIIGITSSFQHFPSNDWHDCEYFYLYEPYVAAIEKAGGVPIIIPVGLEGRYPNKVFELIHGLLITGGGDVDPNRYNDLITTKIRKVDPRKDQTEIDLFNLAFNSNIPIFGICRGAQLMNVALDGTLYQDIISQVRMAINHNPDYPHYEPSHEVTIEEDTRLFRATGEKAIWVNSWHHQGIKLHGKGLIISARAHDGIVEGLEHPTKKWVVGVQWHPEMMWRNDKIQAKLFKAFVDACKS